jgi:organic hydroperoxide reductase OsmC/OhrA
MQKFPIEFLSTAKATGVFETPWAIHSGSLQAVCAIPSSFGGSGGGFSPEDLFLQAAMNCFIGTFKVVAKLSKLSYSEVQVAGKLLVDRNDQGKTMMKTIHLEISVSDADPAARLETIVAKTIRDGFILNSIKSEISYTLKSSPSSLS